MRLRKQVGVPITCGNVTLASECRLDLLIEEKVVVEVKAVERILKVHEA